MYDDYIHSYGPRPLGRIPAMLMKKSCYHVTFGLNLAARPVWYYARPVLESSPDCKRVALVPMLTDAACLQLGLDSKTGHAYYQTGRAAKFKTKVT